MFFPENKEYCKKCSGVGAIVYDGCKNSIYDRAEKMSDNGYISFFMALLELSYSESEYSAPIEHLSRFKLNTLVAVG